jgi:tetratricopeptide (TPR) repeat protein
MISDRWSYTLLPLHPVLTAAASIHPPDLQPAVNDLRIPPSAIGASDLRRFLPQDTELHGVLDGTIPEVRDGIEHPVAHLRRIVAVTRSVEAVALELMKTFWPDLTMVYFQGIDEVGHRFARFEPPALPGVSRRELERYGSVLDSFYRFQDEIVGRLVEAAGPEAAIMLVSDHGFARGAERPLDEPADFTGKAALWHVGPGVVIMAGGPFTRTRLGEIRLADVAPTVLAVLGLPIAEDFGGRPIREALSEAFLDRHPPASLPSYERIGRRVQRLDAASAARGADTEAQMERLRSLGYLGAVRPAEGEASSATGGGLTPAARLNLATVLSERGLTWEARAAYEEAIAADPVSVLARRGLFDLLRREGLWEEALEAGEKLLTEAKGPSAESFAVVARTWVATGRLEEGERVLDGLDDADHAAGPPLARGILAVAAGRPEEAEKRFREALKLEPDSWEAAETIFRLFETQGRLKEAVPLMRQGLAAHGGNSIPHLIALGYIALQENELDSARDYLTRAAEEAPDEAEVQLYLGSVHYRSGRYQDAIRAFTVVLEAEPDQRQARANLILALAKSGRVAQALEVFQSADPEARDDPLLLNATAFAYLVNGLAADGLGLVERSLRLDPGNPETQNLAAALRRAAAEGGGEEGK